MQLWVWFFIASKLFTHVLIFKLFLNRHNGGDNIKKFLLFIENNNEREKSLVGKKQRANGAENSELFPMIKRVRKKRKPILKKNDNVNFKIWIRKKTVLCHYGDCKAPLLYFPARKSHINPGHGLPRAQSIGRERRPTARLTLLYKLSEDNRKLLFHFTFQTLYTPPPQDSYRLQRKT
jgi:hypothetical protein